MVRTRPRNKTRRVAVIDYGSDGEPPESVRDDSDGDENFEAPPPDPEEEDDDDHMDLDGNDEGAEDPSSLALDARRDREYDEDDERPAYTSSAGLRRRPVDAAALDKYHADGRPTRYYTGALKRGQRIQVLDFFYGPEEGAVGTAAWMLNRWVSYGVLPSKLPHGDGCPVPSPWLPKDFAERERAAAEKWFSGVKERGGEAAVESEEGGAYRIRPDGNLAALLGPYEQPKEVRIEPYQGVVLSDTGLPLESESKDKVAGWMFDAGGLVVSMDWALREEGEAQVLALAVIPHSDQELEPEAKLDEKKGTIQLWELCGRKADNGVTYPQNKPARLARTICVDWGRVKRLKWCPFPFKDPGTLGLLAILCGDGQVRVVYVKEIADDEQDSFTKLENTIVSLGLPSETNVVATCFAWSGTNRIVLGHSDGSLSLWSVAPRVCLARHDVHSTHVIHLDTAYPSDPHLVASTPIAGLTTLVDLRDPSCERTSFPCFAITPQPNLLQWSDHLRGFFLVLPSANPLNASVGFVHSRWYAAQVRKVMDGDRLPSVLAVGLRHPFALVGYLDGTLWAANPANRIFASKHHYGHKIKLFEHQYVPRERLPEGVAEGCRGAVRILQGFRPVPNVNTKVDPKTKAAANKKKTKAKPKAKGKAKGKAKADTAAAEEEEEDADVQGGQEEADAHFADPSRAVICEPLARVTTVSWNPNADVPCWAATAMASGLVRVLDLGVEV
ncbi:transcription factor tfiiic complex subunit [Colletotrichum sojae]|uniref:Transcription factor tfiiic complex subunit n=1 Tax=Colletotrichum sojae TaxID=2175907 RepID=A0A8H6JAY6_9PEZI|nr:transcription factor tfiiic complex subunit [Colletotrichum sojae]